VLISRLLLCTDSKAAGTEGSFNDNLCAKGGVAIVESVMKCRGHLSLCRFQSIQSANNVLCVI
jgi:hypothetical protein